MKEHIYWLRDENESNIGKIRDMNEDELEQLREKLHKKYFDESVKIH